MYKILERVIISLKRRSFYEYKTRITIDAIVIDKRRMDYFPCPGKIPTPVGLYEADFKTIDNEILTFEISEFDYNVLPIGEKASLTYENQKIISFGDIIKDFKM